MRALIQRVTNASVSVDNEMISSIGRGLCVLIGISRHDSEEDAKYIARKLLNLRVFEDDKGKKWAVNVKDKGYEILCISQFTLYCTLKGNKPDFHEAMAAEKSKELYYAFLNRLKTDYQEHLIKDGVFGAYMQVNIQNDGPVTIDLQSPSSKQKEESSNVKELEG